MKTEIQWIDFKSKMTRLFSRASVLLFAVTALTGCSFAEERHQRRELESLLARGNATRIDVERALGPGDLYQKGTPQWTHLEVLSKQRAHGQLREVLPKYSKILYYTSGWHITWVLLDENENLRGFYQTAQ
jgi:hypothetical protein